MDYTGDIMARENGLHLLSIRVGQSESKGTTANMSENHSERTAGGHTRDSIA